jgi:hypothetical protein
MRSVVAVVVGVLLAASCEREPEPKTPTVFIALARDFEGFTSWRRWTSAGTAVPDGAEPGPAFVYAERGAPVGVSRFPVGTILVKTIESGAPSEWAVHAMVKREQFFNMDGAVGWEFFELALTDEREPIILWRGEGPPSGHGYALAGRDPGAVPLVCNDCHSSPWQNDGVFTAELALAP